MGKTRVNFSPSERAKLWARWKSGETLAQIARALGREDGSVYGRLAESGGIAPPPRKRAEGQLSLAEREEISRGLAANLSFREIARGLGRPGSTVSREVNRNAGRRDYRAQQADKRTFKRARRPKPCKLSQHGRLRHAVASKLQLQWSPEQIAAWLRTRYPHNTRMQVSHETIYRTLFVQARGALKKELKQHLRTRRSLRHSQKSTKESRAWSRIPDLVSISERPAEVEDRAVPGHWEGDLISGSNNSHIATLVERKSRFVMLLKVNGKDTHSVVTALKRRVRKLPLELRKSLTWDRGTEMAHHKEFSIATDVEVYFCDPQSPWQRGSNENTNGLLRQYFPKGTDLSPHSQVHLNAVALRLNQRPRKTLGWATPADKLAEAVASTG